MVRRLRLTCQYGARRQQTKSICVMKAAYPALANRELCQCKDCKEQQNEE